MSIKMSTVKTVNGVVIRVYSDVAEKLVKAGEAFYTSKSALKKYWKDVAKIEKNRKFIKKFDFSKNQKENFITKEGGKTIAHVLKKLVRVYMKSGLVRSPDSFTLSPRYQRFIIDIDRTK